MATLLPVLAAAAPKSFTLHSPNGRIVTTIERGKTITYRVDFDGQPVLAPSALGMQLADAAGFDGRARFLKAIKTSRDEQIPTVAYKRAVVRDHYNGLTLRYKTFDLELRAYDTGFAWRFVSRLDEPVTVAGELAEFNFADDAQTTVSYVRDGAPDDNQWFNSFETRYTGHPVSAWRENRLAFLPVAFHTASGARVCITESDLLNYPGMYLGAAHPVADKTDNPASSAYKSPSLKGVWAPYPKEEIQGGHNMLQGLVKSRENYIAKAEAGESFPWRIVAVVPEDKDLLDNDLVFCLSRPAARTDWSWVKPGKVAWDWWNNWNLYGVDFKAGINTETYKYYIDFAASQGIEYVILDEGWAVNKQADLLQIIPEIDMKGIIDHANAKGVGIILWAGYWAVNRDIEGLFKHYSQMGVKGFKVDFMDRDDQQMVRFYTKVAQLAAKYHLVIDFHGAFKPCGLMRPYPNVLNHEGVYGLEQMKWAPKETDMVTYDVQIPYIRMFAGPMDYTQGAMRNVSKKNYYPCNSEPMSQGTRCRQLAEYIVFEAPLTMLCDSPSNYLAEPECTRFIAGVPTVWDETVALDGQMGESVVIARRKGNDWYIGAMTGWDARDVEIDLGFLPAGKYRLELFRDGANAAKAARDYKREERPLTVSATESTLKVHLAPGGGCVARISR